MALTNLQLWNHVRNKYPKFASETSEGTRDTFTERGFSQLKQFDASVLNDFFELSLRVFLQKVDAAGVKDLLADQGFGESYATPFGGYTQRIAVNTIKPISPGYKGLKNGDSPDPFVVRKPETSERFFSQNFDYASLITMPDDAMYKNMFVAENGMSEYFAAVMRGLENGYKQQLYDNKLEAINAAMHSTDFPLQATQTIGTDIANWEASAVATANDESAYASQFIGLIQLIRNTVDAMVYTSATGAFNQAGFVTDQRPERLKLLCRPTLANAISSIMRLNSADDMSIPVDIVKVPDFGGLEPYAEAAYTTPLYPVYDELGTVIGYNTTEGATKATVLEAAVYWKDPNENVMGILADSGLVFTNIQNPYEVEPIRNPRGRYVNYWASSPNNGIFFDRYYNMVVIENTHTDETPAG